MDDSPRTLVMRTIPFHEDTLEAFQTPDEKVYVVLRRCCECLGVDFASQYRRLLDQDRSPWACVVMMTIHDTSGREQETCLIDLDTLPMWLATIDGGRVAEHVRPKLLRYQTECARVLREHFFGKPPGDPILAMLESAREVRLAQLELEKRTEAARQLALEARHEARTALQVVAGSHGYCSVLGWLRRHGREVTVAEASQHGRRLTIICREAGVEVRKMADPRFGEVNLYPESVLSAYFEPAEG